MSLYIERKVIKLFVLSLSKFTSLKRSYPAQESATRNREMAELFSTLSDSATGTSLSVFPRKNETLLLPAETDSALLKT